MQTSISVYYDNTNVTEYIEPYLLSLEYTDELSGAADDLQMTLEATAGKWLDAWLPKKGTTLSIDLTCDGETANLGVFEVDELAYSAYPQTLTVKATSVPYASTLRGIDKSKSWEDTTLKTIAKDIADAAGLTLVYDLDDIDIDRAEQTERSDLAFLMDLCSDHGLALKICKQQLVIFDEADYEKQDAVFAIVKPFTDYSGGLPVMEILDLSISSKIRDVYGSCHVKYSDPKTKTTIEATYTADAAGRTLEVNEQVAGYAQALNLAKKRLREKNRDEVTASVTVVGKPELMAGVVVELTGFGEFDGNYLAIESKHSAGGGYTTAVNLRRCLDGY